MTKKKKKESLKERRKRAALKVQRALEAERIKREKEPKKGKGWTKTKIFGVLFLVSILLVVGTYATWQNSQPQNESELPHLYVLTDSDFSEFRGKIVVIDCFATWCDPCKTEFSYLRQIYDKYNHSEVVVISVGSSGDSVTELRKFKRDFNMTWLVAHDTVGVFDKYGVIAIPKLIILDQNGNIYYQHEGVTDASTLSVKIDELLGS
ncbi:TlpA family protein disulfide reductase [Candidatus Bathyarchaeota archaeon]|nr:TlpA family protein disulfide reductase [Candidatus Bathyarchaeota archaeon]